MSRRFAGLLAARATVFGVVAASLAALGHRAAGGATPGVGPWVAFALLTAFLAVPLLRRERRWLSIAVALSAVQLGLHAAYGSSFGAAEHVHGASPGSPAWSMLAVHAAAVLVSAWWLRRGEAALWRRLQRVAAAVGRLSSLPRAPSRRALESLLEPASAPHACVVRPLVDRISHRGPPAGAPFPRLTHIRDETEALQCIAS